MKLSTFIAFHSFELAYLGVLAVLPFIASVRIIAVVLITFLVGAAVTAIYRKITRRRVHIDGQTVVITGCDTGTVLSSVSSISSYKPLAKN